MTQPQVGRSIFRRRRDVAAFLPLALLLTAVPAVQAAPAVDPALRRACATGALTAYACAQHGIVAPPATGSEPVATPTPSSPAQGAATPAPVPAARERRRRASIDARQSLRPFQDTQNRYDLDIPDGWDLKMQGGFAAFARGDDWIQLRTAPGATAQGAVATAVDLLRGQYAEFQTREEAPLAVGGRAGRRLVLSARSKAGRPSTLVLVAAPLSAQENLVVIGGGDPADAEAIGAGIAALVRTLHFR